MTEASLPSTYVEGFHDKDAVMKMTYSSLGDTDMKVSNLSFGASSLGSVFHDTDEAESIQVVHHAIKSGINLIDTAPWYGHGKSETVLGKALKGIPREAYYITTKVCRYKANVDEMFDFTAERTIKSVDESLERLGLDYVDVIQVHDMEFAPNLDVVLKETLPALQKVKEAGKARYIGITGYPLENFRTVIDKSQVKIDTILTYCHCSLNDYSLLDYLQYFKEKGVGIINASPISMGLLSNRGPPSWHPATDNIKKACKDAITYTQRTHVDISMLAMYYTLNQKGVPTTLVSTASMKNLEANLQSVHKELTSHEEMILEYIMETYFVPLKNETWEGIEVEEYRKNLQKSQSK